MIKPVEWNGTVNKLTRMFTGLSIQHDRTVSGISNTITKKKKKKKKKKKRMGE